MGALVKSGIDAWSTAGAAKALTTSYVAGTAFDSLDGDELWLSLVTSATVTTSTDVRVEWSDDGGATYHRLPALNSVSGGVADVDDLQIAAPGDTAANHSYGPIPVPPGVKLRVSAKRTGGDATSALLAKATLISTGK